jgi:hypothetical protein
MSPLARLHQTTQGRRGSRIDLEEGGRYLGIPRKSLRQSVHECPGNRVRYRARLE